MGTPATTTPVPGQGEGICALLRGDTISRDLGIPFDAGTESDGIFGRTCRYQGPDAETMVDVSHDLYESIDAWREQMEAIGMTAGEPVAWVKEILDEL